MRPRMVAAYPYKVMVEVSRTAHLPLTVHILNSCHEYGLVDEIMELPQPFTERIKYEFLGKFPYTFT